MLNRRLIYKILGSLLALEANFMGVCFVMSLCYGEDDALAFLLAILVTLFSSLGLRLASAGADNTLSRRDAFLVVTLAWTVYSLFGTLPFVIGGYIPNFTNAFFETMSGFTTTGATILDDVECLPHGILFWRTLTQWVGGLGIVFFTIAVLPSMVGGSVKVFSAEATGPVKARLHPRLSTSAKSIWVVFLVLSVACAASYKLLGMDWFDSANYAMTTIATGGFATHNGALVYAGSPALQYVSAAFCFVSGVNFVMLYRAIIKGDLRSVRVNSEFKFYCAATVAGIAFVACMLVNGCGYGLERAFRSAAFQVVSFMTTTGLFCDDASAWPHVTWLALGLCMFMGGCAGSTSGGFKSVRCVMLLKVVANEFRQMLHPKAVLPLRVAEVNVPMQQRVTLLAFLAAYCMICAVCTALMIAAGVDSTNAAVITLSSLCNAGPTLGLDIGRAMSWNSLPDSVKWLCSLLMLMGRLEIFSVLIIFTPTFWKDN